MSKQTEKTDRDTKKNVDVLYYLQWIHFSHFNCFLLFFHYNLLHLDIQISLWTAILKLWSIQHFEHQFNYYTIW